MKTNKNQQQDPRHWENLIYPLDKTILLSNNLIESQINTFWNQIVSKLTDEQHIILLVRVKFDNANYATLGNLMRLSKYDQEYATRYLCNLFELKESGYFHDNLIDSFMFSYGVRDGKLEPKVYLIPKERVYQTFNHYKLPITFDPLKYGQLMHKQDNTYIVQVNPRNTAVIEVKGEYNIVKYYKLGDLVLTYVDKHINDTKFERQIGKNTYLYDNNELVLVSRAKSSRLFRKLDKHTELDYNFATLDLETYTLAEDGNNLMVPYAVGINNNDNGKVYYLTDYPNPESMILHGFNIFFKERYNKCRIYVHNLSNFDGIFLLKILASRFEVKPLINDGRIIQIIVRTDILIPDPNNKDKTKSMKLTLVLRDSYQLLPGSLSSLAKSFGVGVKGIFPYRFVNVNNLDYIGEVPEFQYFDNLSIDEYNKYKSGYSNNWSMKDETIKYCLQDCLVLFQVIKKFNEIIFKTFSLNIIKFPTAPGLATAVFNSNYLNKAKDKGIIQIAGDMSKDIRDGYTGGAVDSYIPEGNNIYCYDVNSLYPYIMANFPMPVRKPLKFEGNIRKHDPSAFGFFYCKIVTPDNMIHPILQTHVNTKDGIRTIAPLGTWYDMLFSPEMDNAIANGYQIEIIRGYTSPPGEKKI